MKANKIIQATLAVAALGLATGAVAQVSADKVGKSTSGQSPAATPVTSPTTTSSGDDMGYGRYWSSVDANNDGRVTRDEYLAYYGSRWDKADTAKRGYYDKQSFRSLYQEREMSKTDGHPQGTPLNPTTPKK